MIVSRMQASTKKGEGLYYSQSIQSNILNKQSEYNEDLANNGPIKKQSIKNSQ